MKIIGINGSPRLNGNSAFLLEKITQAFSLKGHETVTYNLNSMNYRGCQGCMACKTAGKTCCILNDDLKDLLKHIETSDIIALISPVYFGDITSQAKGFIDRTYSFLKSDFYTAEDKSRLRKGKKFILGLVQGSPVESQFNDIYPRYKFFLDWQFDNTYLIRKCGCTSKKTASEDSSIINKIKQTIELITG
ncbi:MAG: flavodoxin family protein [Victivallales bacterium]|nr:flavodoxin family protein [Victivallales bacterium]